jgi:hypothetical protein
MTLGFKCSGPAQLDQLQQRAGKDTPFFRRSKRSAKYRDAAAFLSPPPPRSHRLRLPLPADAAHPPPPRTPRRRPSNAPAPRRRASATSPYPSTPRATRLPVPVDAAASASSPAPPARRRRRVRLLPVPVDAAASASSPCPSTSQAREGLLYIGNILESVLESVGSTSKHRFFLMANSLQMHFLDSWSDGQCICLLIEIVLPSPPRSNSLVWPS